MPGWGPLMPVKSPICKVYRTRCSKTDTHIAAMITATTFPYRHCQSPKLPMASPLITANHCNFPPLPLHRPRSMLLTPHRHFSLPLPSHCHWLPPLGAATTPSPPITAPQEQCVSVSYTFTSIAVSSPGGRSMKGPQHFWQTVILIISYL